MCIKYALTLRSNHKRRIVWSVVLLPLLSPTIKSIGKIQYAFFLSSAFPSSAFPSSSPSPFLFVVLTLLQFWSFYCKVPTQGSPGERFFSISLDGYMWSNAIFIYYSRMYFII